MRVITLGDMHVDVVLRRDQRSEAGAPACSRVSVDGQAAALAAWVAALGGEVGLIGARGDDPVAQMAAADLFTRGVRLRGPVVGTDAAARRPADPMAADGSDASPVRLTPADLDPAWFADVDALHICGHALLTRIDAEVAVMAATMARHVGARVSVGLAPVSLMRFVGSRTVSRRLRAIRPSVLLGSEAQADEIGTLPLADLTVTTREDGTVLVRGRERAYVVPAPDIAVVDATGADEAFAAGFLMGDDVEDRIARGYHAVTMCLGREGSLPPMREATSPPSPVR